MVEFKLSPELSKLGLSRVQGTMHHRLIVVSRAHDKCGKTHFACSAPGPIFYANLDQGDEGVLDKLVREQPGKVIIKKDIVIPLAKKADVGDYLKLWEDFAKTWKAVCESNQFKTVVCDTGGDLWALIRLARFGKLEQVMPEKYGPVTAEFEELMNYPKQFKNLNAIYLHKLSKEYKQGKDAKRGDWTGNYEMKGCNSMPYIAQVNIEHYRYLRDDNKRGFGIRIINSRVSGSCDGVELTDDIMGDGSNIDMCTFQGLATTLYPDTTEDQWR